MNAVQAPDAPPSSAKGFWSIERFVAFILGPAIAAGAGWLSTFLAREIGIHVSAESMVVVFGLGTVSAGGLAYKWLHGRQVEMQVQGDLAKVEKAIPGAGGFIHTTVHDLEGLAESVAAKAVGHPMPAAPAAPAPASSDLPPPEVSIPPAAHDPAPAGEPAPAGQVAEEGAATTE